MDLEKYGIPGVISTIAIAAIIGCVVWIKNVLKEAREDRERMDKEHRSERDEWKRTVERQFDESNRGSRESTNALSELSTLIKTLRK